MSDQPTPTPPPRPEIAELLRASLRRVIQLEQHCSGVMRKDENDVGVWQPRAIQTIMTVPLNGGEAAMTMMLYWDHETLRQFVDAGITLLEELEDDVAQATRLRSPTQRLANPPGS